MEYERIHKVQTGIISPSKLRMKLLGLHHQQKKKDASNNNSSKTSPSKHVDSDFLKNSLLDVQIGDIENQGQNSNTTTMQPKECRTKENGDSSKVLQSLRGDNSHTASVHPARACDDENLDYDSTSSFEFHKERSNSHRVARSYSRPMSSKWNDAEKWIMNRQNVLPVATKKMHFQNQSHGLSSINTGRVVPEAVNNENKLSVKRVDFSLPGPKPVPEKFDFVSNGENSSIDLRHESKDLMEVDNRPLSSAKGLTESSSGIPTIRSVCMRDMGTEMTPIPSQEPSRTATPEGATTPTSSMPSTPCRGDPVPTPTEQYLNNASVISMETGNTEISDEELKLKTRQEIVALGVQLGKMNIAAWAKMDEKEKAPKVENSVCDEFRKLEFAKRAAAWEEAEKSRHNARYKHEEIKIQAWESQQKVKFEAEMRKTEAKLEKMKVQAQAKMVNKIEMVRQKSEEKRVAAEARKNRQANKVANQADYIRERGRLPSSFYICCGWS